MQIDKLLYTLTGGDRSWRHFNPRLPWVTFKWGVVGVWGPIVAARVFFGMEAADVTARVLVILWCALGLVTVISAFFSQRVASIVLREGSTLRHAAPMLCYLGFLDLVVLGLLVGFPVRVFH